MLHQPETDWAMPFDQGRLPVVRELLGERYQVQRLLGESRSFVVAEVERDERRWAVVLPAVDCEGAPERAVGLDVRIRELDALLDHPGLLQPKSHGFRYGMAVLEYPPPEGRTLGEHLALEPLGRARGLSIALDLLAALAAAHAKGIAHGELTPDNVFISAGPNGTPVVRILGTGLAAIVRELGDPSSDVQWAAARYIAPEVLAGGEWDARADIYSVGALLYHALTNDVPPPPPIVSALECDPNLPPDLEPMFLRALAVDPDKRFSSVEEMAAEVRLALGGRRSLSSRTPVVIARRALSSAAPVIAARIKPSIPRRVLAWGGAAMASLAIGVGAALVVTSSERIEAPPLVHASEPMPAEVEPRAASAQRSADVEPGTAAVAAATTVQTPNAAPRPDPLAGELPPELEAIRARIAEGARLTQADFRPVYSYASAHRDDPRPHLLLGDAFVDIGWYSDAIERYMQAYEIDAASRHHQIVLENLVLLTFREDVGIDAAYAIGDIYGAEALPAVEAAIAASSSRRQIARLERLRAQLRDEPFPARSAGDWL